MSNSFDFKSEVFDGIYNPYRPTNTNRNDVVILETGYDHRYDLNRELINRFTLLEQEQGVDYSSKENSFSVVLDSNFEANNATTTQHNELKSDIAQGENTNNGLENLLDESAQSLNQSNENSKTHPLDFYKESNEIDDIFRLDNELEALAAKVEPIAKVSLSEAERLSLNDLKAKRSARNLEVKLQPKNKMLF